MAALVSDHSRAYGTRARHSVIHRTLLADRAHIGNRRFSASLGRSRPVLDGGDDGKKLVMLPIHAKRRCDLDRGMTTDQYPLGAARPLVISVFLRAFWDRAYSPAPASRPFHR